MSFNERRLTADDNSSVLMNVASVEDFLSQAKFVFEKSYTTEITSNLTVSDFEMIRTIGLGSFSRVLLAKLKGANTFHALKVMEKERIVDMKAVDYILNEKKILQSINFPFCVYMQYGFKDNRHLYLCMPFINGGELYTHMNEKDRFNETMTAFYAAQVVLCLEYLHYIGLIFRDLKPENILLDSSGYIKLTDFGFTKRLTGRTYTFCGTPEYIAPEIILNKGYGIGVDWWALGVLIYEMAAGYPPFQANDPMKLYEKITQGKFVVPEEFSTELRSLLTSLIEKDITRRYGTLKYGAQDVKSHEWFQQINWMKLMDKEEPPPFVPKTSGPGDPSNYEMYDEIVSQASERNLFARHFEDF